jgi:hypothetical protein
MTGIGMILAAGLLLWQRPDPTRFRRPDAPALFSRESLSLIREHLRLNQEITEAGPFRDIH